jgi:transposase-like protein
MSKKNEYSGAEKLSILQELETGLATVVDVAKKYGVDRKTLEDGGIVMNCTDIRG